MSKRGPPPPASSPPASTPSCSLLPPLYPPPSQSDADLALTTELLSSHFADVPAHIDPTIAADGAALGDADELAFEGGDDAVLMEEGEDDAMLGEEEGVMADGDGEGDVEGEGGGEPGEVEAAEDGAPAPPLPTTLEEGWARGYFVTPHLDDSLLCLNEEAAWSVSEARPGDGVENLLNDDVRAAQRRGGLSPHRIASHRIARRLIAVGAGFRGPFGAVVGRRRVARGVCAARSSREILSALPAESNQITTFLIHY
jgi:hypothetical protein